MVRVNEDNVDVNSGRAVKYSPGVLAKINELTTPYFVRTMYNSMVFAGRGQRNGGYHMELPTKFVKEHGDKFQKFVTLEGPTGDEWKVKLKIVFSDIRARVSFAAGWREFSLAHALERGDLLLFSVVVKSNFVVSIFSQAGKLVHWGQAASSNRSGGEAQFPSRTLKFPENEGRSSTASASTSKPKRRRSSKGKGSLGVKKTNLKASRKRKQDRVKSRKRKDHDGERFSETEAAKLLEEVASGSGQVPPITDSELIASHEEECATMSSNACYSPDFTVESPQPSAAFGLPADAETVSSESEEPLWPTWSDSWQQAPKSD